MKKLLVFVFVIVLAGCHNYKKDTIQLIASRDSLANESALKDSSILAFLNDFNEIQANLDSIKVVEKLVTVQTDRGRELNSNQKKRILEDIKLLNELIQKNKTLTVSLQKKLNNSNFKIGKLEAMISQFELMVSNLDKQVEGKDVEISALNKKVRNLTVNIGNLNREINEITTDNQKKSETITSQINQLNKAYYTLGSTKMLIEKGVIEKSGGVLGIGKTPEVRKDFNRDYFKAVDIRKFDFLPIMVKKASIVSVHPVNSYHISGTKTSDTLFIDDRAEFWKASKYLVIVAD